MRLGSATRFGGSVPLSELDGHNLTRLADDASPIAVMSVVRPARRSWGQCFQKLGHIICLVLCINSHNKEKGKQKT